jgi:peroxiredoxin
MAITPSSMMQLGTQAPTFNLPDAVSGRSMGLEDVQGEKCTLIMFICNHCPFVKHVESGLISLGNDYKDRGVGVVAISSNDAIQYPDDGPKAMAAQARAKHYPFPYLYDETQSVARSYDATCTPDFFLFDVQLRCVYRGQLDDSRPNNRIEVSGNDLRAAIDALLANRVLPVDQKPSIGCNIKWKD